MHKFNDAKKATIDEEFTESKHKRMHTCVFPFDFQRIKQEMCIQKNSILHFSQHTSARVSFVKTIVRVQLSFFLSLNTRDRNLADN